MIRNSLQETLSLFFIDSGTKNLSECIDVYIESLLIDCARQIIEMLRK